MKRFLKNNWIIITILLLSVLTAWPLLLPGYFSHHDDLQVMRVFEMRKCIEDLQIPCRWVPDMGYGNGYPLFNYYSVFPYYIGGLISFITGFVWAAKILFLIPLVLGGVSMFYLGKELFGRMGGFTAAILYMFAPYKALDTYVRGAVAENFALSIIPLLFYFSLRLIKNPSKILFLSTSLSLAAFLLSHNIMTLFFTPVLLVWLVYWIFTWRPRHILTILASIILGFGLAAFFMIPAYFEKPLVHIETLIRFDLDFRVHFVTLKQLFLDREWGYGASRLGPDDTISFQIGWPHWWLVVGGVLVIFYLLYKKRFKDIVLPLLLLITFFISVFMMINRSAIIWENINILDFVQFPWRFLSLSVFSASLLGGFVLTYFKKNNKFVLLAIVLPTILLNFYFFKPETFYFFMTDQEKLSGSLWEAQKKAALFDYLPKTAIESTEDAPNAPRVMLGRAETSNFKNRSSYWQFEVQVFSDARFEMPVYDFPNWAVYVNGKKINHDHQNHIGRISFDLPPGKYKVWGEFQNTQIRTVANLITLTAVFGIFLTFFWKRLYAK